MIRMVHIARGSKSQLGVSAFARALKELSEPVELTVIKDGVALSEEEILDHMRRADVVLTMWNGVKIPAALADNPGKVRYVLNLTGTCAPYVPIEIIRSPIPVTNWGDAPAQCLAEGAVALLFAVLKNLCPLMEKVREGHWGGYRQVGLVAGTLNTLKLGLYGCGAVGRRFVDMVTPFEPELLVYDPYADELPENCRRVDSLDALFEESEAIAIHAGLSEETKGSVTAERLAMLPDNGMVINVARGDIIDQDALFAELKSGRLRAGLDVLAGNDCLPADHEARQWPNVVFSCHDITDSGWPARPDRLGPMHINALENLECFIQGKPLLFEMDEERFLRST